MDIMWQTLKIAVRRLAQNPGFSILAIMVLALGIGPNSAIFSIVNAVVLRPLPFADADRVVMVWETYLEKGFRMVPASAPNFQDWKEQNRVFEDMAAGFMLPEFGFNITAGGEPERVEAAKLTENYLSVLGVRPLIGRGFTPNEDRPGGEPVVLIGHGLWKRRFGASPDVIGKSLALDGHSHTIIGVLPPELKSLGKFDLLLPLALGPGEQRFNHAVGVAARLKPGVTVQQAQAELDIIAQRLARQYPETNKGWGVSVTPMASILGGQIGPLLLILLGAVAFLLLIACANMASLLLARAAARKRDIAVCLALGAGRGRVLGQLLSESLLLALAGGVLGLVLAGWSVAGLRNLVPDIIPRLKEMDIDYRVLGFTLGVSVLTGILFGLVPALKASKPDLVNELKEGSRTGSGTGSQRARSVLLVAEMALALVLAIGAALLARSFVQLTAVDPGFKADHLLTFTLNLPDAKYPDDDRRRTFYDSLVRKLESLPGAGAAGAISVLPMRGLLLNMRTYVWPFQIDGLPAAQRGQEPVADFRVVTHGLFEAFGVPLRQGRQFTEQDTREAEQVVIINEALARRYFKGEEPIGKRLNLGVNDQTMRQIVGVVGDIKLNGLGSEPEPAIYAPLRQYSWKTMSLVIRTSIDPEALGTAARSAIRALDPDLPVSNLAPMDQVISDSLLPHWLSMYLLGSFAGLAVLLAVVGIYGLTAYSVGQRRHEIGLRMALGARRPDVLRLVLTRGLLVSAIGVACGLPLAYAVSGVLRGLLFGVTASDPAVFVSVPLLLIAVSALASLIPANRASRVDPIIALRHE